MKQLIILLLLALGVSSCSTECEPKAMSSIIITANTTYCIKVKTTAEGYDIYSKWNSEKGNHTYWIIKGDTAYLMQ